MTPPVLPHLLTQKQFECAASKWLRVLSKPHGETLENSFVTSMGRLAFATFPLQHIKYLVSTVGASYIEVRFLLLQDDVDKRRYYFTLALYATDAASSRISAYYLADKPALNELVDLASPVQPQEQTPQALSTADDSPGASQVAHDLVKEWLSYWKHSPAVTPDLFTTAYGPLQGYRFSLGDFTQNLFDWQSSLDSVLRINFGLHRYYAIDTSLQQTFGLILRLYVPEAPRSTSDLATAAAPAGEPFYDLSVPCPPGS